MPRGGLRFLHVVSRWQLGAPGLDRDPLSPWYGEASAYEVVAPGRGALVLHPSRVVRFMGNPWPDPSVAPTPWSDPVLQSLYDAVHAVALTVAGATSLMHEARPCRLLPTRATQRPRRRDGAEPVGAPRLGRDDGAALGALRHRGGDDVDQQPLVARRPARATHAIITT